MKGLLFLIWTLLFLGYQWYFFFKVGKVLKKYGEFEKHQGKGKYHQILVKARNETDSVELKKVLNRLFIIERAITVFVVASLMFIILGDFE